MPFAPLIATPDAPVTPSSALALPLNVVVNLVYPMGAETSANLTLTVDTSTSISIVLGQA